MEIIKFMRDALIMLMIIYLIATFGFIRLFDLQSYIILSILTIIAILIILVYANLSILKELKNKW